MLFPSHDRARLAQNIIKRSPDYYKGLENDVINYIYQNQNQVYNIDGQRTTLAGLNLLDAVDIAMEEVGKSRQKPKQSAPKATTVPTPKKSASPYDVKNIEAMSSEDIEKLILAKGGGIVDIE